jgi:mRNA deadenylase 3'-5' endonuclease subunit Ccr4
MSPTQTHLSYNIYFADKFVLVSYNILGDANASNHGDLYCHISPDIMDWSSRKRLICQELDMWKPDLMCFQASVMEFDFSIFL